MNLEDAWANWSPVSQYTMNAGVDFDTVITIRYRPCAICAKN